MEVIQGNNKCYECGGIGPVIRLGEKPYWESITTYICIDCLKRAMETLKHENS